MSTFLLVHIYMYVPGDRGSVATARLVAVPLMSTDIQRIGDGLRMILRDANMTTASNMTNEDIDEELMSIVQTLMNRHLGESKSI